MGNFCTISISCNDTFALCRDSVARKSTYISKLEDNLVALQTALQKLIEARNDMMTRVIIAEQRQMKRLNQVQGWLSRVEAVETEVGELIRDSSQEIEKLCLGGFCSRNCASSYQFGENVARKLQDMITLMGEGAFEVVVEMIPVAAVDERPSEPTIVGMQSTFDQVWKCLGEEEVGIVGLYGMAGVGKTTLLTQINNKFLNTTKEFDVVLWAVVSKPLQLENIQEKIWNKIGVLNESWKNKSLDEKALDIFKILNKKKFILLLDDIWERVNLIKVGIPLPSSKFASKIVFTTRSVDVCGLMEAHKKFKVECLADKEAWKLFKEKVGEDTINSHLDIPMLAEIVAKKCGGLPLALITIGRAMACKKTPEEWSYAIQVLRKSAFQFPGMGIEVYPLLKFSYDWLPNDKIRSCLLYCSLYQEDFNIIKEDLIDCWIGEGFLDEYDKSGVQNQGHYIIGVLIHACLLEEVDQYRVKLHDVIRDMALWIACEIEKEKENLLVHSGDVLIEAPRIEKWKGVKRMSLMENQIVNLLETPTCPHLRTLFLNRNNLKKITNDFFQFMPTLMVLNLSSNPYLAELPSGISKLVSLQHLDLSKTSIKMLPKELTALVNLKCLNLECTYSLHIIPQQLISSFSMLQVLRMLDCGSEFCFEELLHLKHLNVLSITLRSSNSVQRFLSSHRFRISTQTLCLQCFDEAKSLNVLPMKRLNRLYIVDCEYLEELKIDYAGEVQKTIQPHLFQRLQRVRINFCSKLRDLTLLAYAPNLKFIHVSGCPNMEEIISVEKLGKVPEMIQNLNPFAKVDFLTLHHLENLRSIYWKAVAFPNLKRIEVKGCRELKKLPLDSHSATERKIIIKGEVDWWKELQWEDQATQNAFISCFKSYDDDQTA